MMGGQIRGNPKPPQLVRDPTSPTDLVRKALDDLAFASRCLQSGWVGSDPARQGQLWERLRAATRAAEVALAAEPDPRPGICTTTWLDQLDHIWDRCGLHLHHSGGHQPAYAVKPEATA